MSSSNKQQFVKNTNAPPAESELWSVAGGWKISGSGKTYTDLEEVYRNEVNPESEDNDFYNTLIEQLLGKVTEPIDYIGYYFVASVAQDLKKELVYAYKKNELELANKQVKYSFNAESVRNKGGSSVPKGPVAQGQTQFKPQSTSGPAASSTVQTTTSKPTVVQETLKVPTDVTIIKVGDVNKIGEAEQNGLYVLPVLHVGNNRFCFERDGEFYLLYGRIISVKISDN
jgi:hypothetical protein